MNSSVSSHAEGRMSEFSRNTELERLLKEINGLLSLCEKKVLSEYQLPQFPLVLVIGPHRSGSTLFLQWLANTGIVAYPTNLLSRFYQAPIMGAKIQLLLTDPRYNFRDELGELSHQVEFSSENGKTRGVLAPNEFWYFWRRFLAEPQKDVWLDEELRASMDIKTMLAELAGIMDVFQKPFLAKGMLFNYNIPFLDSVFENVLFVQIKRDLVTNVASVLEARKRQFGSKAVWYSFKIPEYEQLKDLDPVSQVAGQIHYINQAVTLGMKRVEEHRKLVLQYEDFCGNPASIFSQITEKLFGVHQPYNGPRSFRVSREKPTSARDSIQAALAKFA